MDHFKLLLYMKKPKPWKMTNGNVLSKDERVRNVTRICRRLAVERAPSMLLKHRTPRINKMRRYKRKVEPPFLVRNCISGHGNWESYAKKMQQWAETKHQRPRNSTKGSSFASSIRSDSRFSDDSTQTETALNELSNSPVVEKCLQAVPRGGISAEIITDKSNLSKKALHTLSRWARVVVDVKEDGYESGYDDDPVEVWNRAVTLAKSSEIESISISATDTPNAGTSNGAPYSYPDETPKRRRSVRQLRVVNFAN